MRVKEMLKGVKGRVAVVVGGLVVAGAMAAPAAQAQVRFGVVVGGPRYAPPVVGPGYGAVYGPGFGYGYDPHVYGERSRYEDWRAAEWRQHGNWERQRAFEQDRGYRDRGWR